MARPKRVLSRQRALPRSSPPPGVVKSAARTMQILEYLDDVRRPVSLVEVSEALDYPSSSTSALLRTLTSLGYLQCNAAEHTYLPSRRVALLGSWVHPETFRDGALLRMMSLLNERTGDSVVLATRHGTSSHYIHVVQATSPARLHLTLGTLLPLVRSGTGYALLSAYSDSEVWRIVAPFYPQLDAPAPSEAPRNPAPAARMPPGSATPPLPALYEMLAEIRALGYSYSEGTANPGGGTLAMLLPVAAGEQPLVIALAGIGEVMRARKDRLITILREEVGRYLGERSTPT